MWKRSVEIWSKLPIKRQFHLNAANNNEFENPIYRTFRVLANDIKKLKRITSNDTVTDLTIFPNHADIVIIGGGAIGSSIAYWLKEKTGPEGIRVVVFEKDPTYKKCSTALSVGGLRQQFSLPENIQMSLYGAEFLRTLKKRFGKDAEVNFHPNGYLVLSSEEGAETLISNSKLQQQLGAVNMILTKNQLTQKFPWLDVTDVELGCLGLEKEGWFDPWSLLGVLKSGAINLGAQYINGEVTGFTFNPKEDYLVEGVEHGTFEGVDSLQVKLPNGEHKRLKFALCIIAAGCESAEIAEKARIGTGEGLLSIRLPIEKRKRYVYHFHCPENAPTLNTPMLIDHSGAYFRREGLGGHFIGGMSPEPSDEPSTENLDVDYNFFDEKVWPLLAKRVPAFNNIKVVGGWSGYYEYNTYDMNGIIGPHPYHNNVFIASGFSGHGIQQAPAVGRGVAELILDGRFQTIDLTRLGFDRLIVEKPMYEIGII